ncbi:MAG: hypothetical protein AMXMBFR34_34410 [Myxococcaceae bacterium]
MRRLLLLGAALAGCGHHMTVGEACDDALDAFCQRAMGCLGGTAADVAACVSDGVWACCGKAGTCQADARDAAAVGRCVDATWATSCTAWRSWAQAPETTPPPLPAVCIGVAQPK